MQYHTPIVSTGTLSPAHPPVFKKKQSLFASKKKQSRHATASASRGSASKNETKCRTRSTTRRQRPTIHPRRVFCFPANGNRFSSINNNDRRPMPCCATTASRPSAIIFFVRTYVSGNANAHKSWPA